MAQQSAAGKKRKPPILYPHYGATPPGRRLSTSICSLSAAAREKLRVGLEELQVACAHGVAAMKAARQYFNLCAISVRLAAGGAAPLARNCWHAAN